MRVVAFDVADGRIVAAGPVEPDRWTGPAMITSATVQGDLDGANDAVGERAVLRGPRQRAPG